MDTLKIEKYGFKQVGLRKKYYNNNIKFPSRCTGAERQLKTAITGSVNS